MEEPVFVKCEPTWPSDTKELINFEQNAIPSLDNQVKIKRDPQAALAEPSSEEVEIKIDEDPWLVEDEIEEFHDAEYDNSGVSCNDVENAAILFGQGTLKTHQDPKKSFECLICRCTFRRASSFRAHKITHTDNRPFSCLICGKTFKAKGNLKDHFVIHTGKRPFQCTVCGKEFSRMANLTRHKNIHGDVAPFCCSTCGKAFKNRDSLSKHCLRHAEGMPFSCATCGSSFKVKDILKRHVLIHMRN